MRETFEQIALIEGVIAAALTGGEGELLGWCATSAIPAEKLHRVALLCQETIALLPEDKTADVATVSFGDKTVIYRQYANAFLIVFLNSPVNQAVLDWLWSELDPLLAKKGVAIST